MPDRNWDTALVLILALLVTGGDSSTDILPQPENFTLSWIPDNFSVAAQWSKPTGLDTDCKVNYTVALYSEKCEPSSMDPKQYFDKRRTVLLEHMWMISSEREICVVVMTNPMECGHKKPSKPVYKGISAPLALVKNFGCVYYSHMKMNCSWILVSNTSDPQLLYRKEKNDTLKPCITYVMNGHMKSGCHLDDIDLVTQYTFVIMNGNSKIQNIFIIEPHNSVKAEPPKLKILLINEHLILESSTPNFSPQCWKYKFKYSQCAKEPIEEILESNTLKLEYDTACKYSAQAQIIFTNNCGNERESEMSEPAIYEVNRNANMLDIAIIVTPILMSCCLIVVLVLFRRFKNIILPKIPEPSLIVKDILISKDLKYAKASTPKLYVPITEDVEKDVRLEPESTSLYPKP